MCIISSKVGRLELSKVATLITCIKFTHLQSAALVRAGSAPAKKKLYPRKRVGSHKDYFGLITLSSVIRLSFVIFSYCLLLRDIVRNIGMI